MVCNTLKYRGDMEYRNAVFPLWFALEMARTEMNRHPVFAPWEIDELDIDVDAPSPYEAMIAALI